MGDRESLTTRLQRGNFSVWDGWDSPEGTAHDDVSSQEADCVCGSGVRDGSWDLRRSGPHSDKPFIRT